MSNSKIVVSVISIRSVSWGDRLRFAAAIDWNEAALLLDVDEKPYLW